MADSNGTRHKRLTGRQAQAIALMLTPMDMTQIATEVGVNRRQLYRWLSDPAFTSELQRAQAEASRRAIAIVSGALVGAAKSAAQLSVSCEDEATRLRAAVAVVDIYERLHERDELLKRIEALEAAR